MMRMSSLVAGCSDRAPDIDVKPAPDEERRASPCEWDNHAIRGRCSPVSDMRRAYSYLISRTKLCRHPRHGLAWLLGPTMSPASALKYAQFPGMTFAATRFRSFDR